MCPGTSLFLLEDFMDDMTATTAESATLTGVRWHLIPTISTRIGKKSGEHKSSNNDNNDDSDNNMSSSSIDVNALLLRLRSLL